MDLKIPPGLREILAFGIVGGLSSALYFVCALALVQVLAFDAFLANHVALLLAAFWSYFGHKHLTYRYQGETSRSVVRFSIQMAAFYVISNAAIILVNAAGLQVAYAFVFTLLFVPVLSFVVMKFWTFAT